MSPELISFLIQVLIITFAKVETGNVPDNTNGNVQQGAPQDQSKPSNVNNAPGAAPQGTSQQGAAPQGTSQQGAAPQGAAPQGDSQQKSGPVAKNNDPGAAKPDNTPQKQSNVIEEIFSFGAKDMWTQKYLKDRMKIHLVRKSWMAWGPANQTTEILQDFPWDPSAADHLTKCLEGTPSYKYVESLIAEGNTLLTDNEYDKKLPNIFIFPTPSADEGTDYVQKTIAALGMRNLHRSHNVFTFDFSKLDYNMFVTVMSTYLSKDPKYSDFAQPIVTFLTTAVLDNHMEAHNIHLVGWGFSAQLAGYVGRGFKSILDQEIATIAALNPISSNDNTELVHVNYKDANVVHIYHTNTFPLGSIVKLGTADIIINGGFAQPECKEDDFFCSHDGVVKRFWYIILYGGNLFKARECNSLVHFNFGMCNNNDVIKLTYPITAKRYLAKYFVRTLPQAPYGDDGHGCVSDPKMRERIKEVVRGSHKSESFGNDLMMYTMWLLD